MRQRDGTLPREMDRAIQDENLQELEKLIDTASLECRNWSGYTASLVRMEGKTGGNVCSAALGS